MKNSNLKQLLHNIYVYRHFLLYMKTCSYVAAAVADVTYNSDVSQSMWQHKASMWIKIKNANKKYIKESNKKKN